MNRRDLLLLSTAAAVLPFAPSRAQPSGTVKFYSSMVLTVVEPIIEEFHKRHPGIRIDLLYSGSVQLEQRIFAELDAGDLQADETAHLRSPSSSSARR